MKSVVGFIRLKCYVFYMSDAGVQTIFDAVSNLSTHLNFSLPWHVILDVDTLGYSLSFDQGSLIPALALSGSWSDQGKTLADVQSARGEGESPDSNCRLPDA